MPWVRARLRDQVVYARADEHGQLVASGGGVEIRYKPTDGRLYRARAGNLAPVDGVVLPDSTCGEAAPVEKADKAKSSGAGKPATKPSRVATSIAIPEGAVIAYTDGACSGNPGPAGLGVVVLDGDEQIEISEYLGHSTNNVGELTALLRGMEAVEDKTRPIVLHTDSQYAIGVLQKGWKAKANQELIRGIKAEIATRKKVLLVYVPGHSGVPLNEHADQLARLAVSSRSNSTRRRKRVAEKV